jgi:glycosyltransferase involved in cell wall biosynthesis
MVDDRQGMGAPTVSVIIPCYNAGNWIEHAVRSCLRQEVAIEVVVVDDGSTDDSRLVLARLAAEGDGKVKVIDKPNGGSSSARNVGVARSSGDYLLFLDADDMLAENAVAPLLAALRSQRTDAATGSWRNFRQGEDQLAPPIALQSVALEPYSAAVRLPAFHSTFLFRRTQLRWNEARVLWEALEYVLNFFETGRSLAYTDTVVTHVRQHDSPDRITVRYDHFEPLETGRFFAAQKDHLRSLGQLLPVRECVLDEKICSNAYGLLRRHQPHAADELLAHVNWKRLTSYDWYRPFGFAGASRWLGPRLGSRAFYRINHLLGRA